ncbi:OmpA family protein [Methylobacterium iners]|nr:OmpA family protein [Methylobacterium iners]
MMQALRDPSGLARRLRFALGLSLVLTGAAAAQANPLTEVPGRRAPEVPAEEAAPPRPPARDEAAERAEAGVTNPSATAIIRSLAPFADGNPGAPARPLGVDPGDGGPRIRVDVARAVDLTVFFAYDSARLTPEARIQLQPLGEALSAPALARHGFLIAGHTDAAGGALYNRRLSLDRAQAVRAWLVEAYGIDPNRLRIHGWGATRLKVADSPLSRLNRRVEVSLIAPPSARLRFDAPATALCREDGLIDPRRRVVLDLDDFGAAPTPLDCDD